MKNIIHSSLILSICLLLFISFHCGTSTGTRYSRENQSSDIEKQENQTPENQVSIKEEITTEEFDMTPYSSKLDLPESPELKPRTRNESVWYGYENEKTSSLNNQRVILRSAEGYRVQVFSTDDLNEANNVKSDIYFKTGVKDIYLIFDPPFYKLRVGDFQQAADANSLYFKMKQMGYKESKVVKDIINIFSQ
ncbi:MAG: SPOR domain-containing protein [Ignavibacteriaceae bacterium]|nr:SPOR domain-containing protein [Ignavibacteriaceae bacterium]